MAAKKTKAKTAPVAIKSKSLKKVSGGTGILPGDNHHAGNTGGSELTPFTRTGISRRPPAASN